MSPRLVENTQLFASIREKCEALMLKLKVPDQLVESEVKLLQITASVEPDLSASIYKTARLECQDALPYLFTNPSIGRIIMEVESHLKTVIMAAYSFTVESTRSAEFCGGPADIEVQLAIARAYTLFYKQQSAKIIERVAAFGRTSSTNASSEAIPHVSTGNPRPMPFLNATPHRPSTKKPSKPLSSQ